MSDNKLRTRDQIPVEDTWNLDDLFASDEAWEAELATLAEDRAYLTSFAGKLGSNPEHLLAYLTRMEQTDAKASLLGSYCMRKADQDTGNTTYQAMAGRFRSTVIALGAACSFETPELMAISDETMDRFYAEKPDLERYRRYLTDLRRRKDHVLSPAE